MNQDDAEDSASDAVAKIGQANVRELSAVRQMMHQFCAWRAMEAHRRQGRRNALTADLKQRSESGSASEWEAMLTASAEGKPSQGDAKGRMVSAEAQCTEVVLLREALESVREDYAQAIMLKFWGFSGREAAESLGISLNCYKIRLHRGQQAVRMVMADGWESLDLFRRSGRRRAG